MNTATDPLASAAAASLDAPFAQLHVYAQATWHDEAFIVGNREALLALRAAIDAALSSPEGLGVTLPFVADGEGYDVHVVRASGTEMKDLAVPYTAEEARADPSSVWPWQLLRQRKALAR